MNKIVIFALVALVCLTVFASGTPIARKRRSSTRNEARANYNLVVQELNDRFRGYYENCFPRPKGCLCTIGKDKNGRDITERRRNDDDCKDLSPDSGVDSDH